MVGAEAGTASRYAVRGFALSHAPVLTPSTWASFAGATATALAIVGTSRADGSILREVDLDVAWSKSLGVVTIEPDLAAYLLSEGPSSAEAIVTISIEGDVIGVHTCHAVDFVAAPGAYYAEAGVTVGGDLVEDLSLAGSVDAGFGTARFHSFNAGVSVAGVTVARASLEANLQVTESVYLAARVELDSLIAAPVRRAVPEPVLLHGGLAAGFEL